VDWLTCLHLSLHVLSQDSVESERPLKVCAEAWAFQLGMQNWILEFVGRLAGNVCGISTNILSCLQSCGHSLQTIGILATLVQKTMIWLLSDKHLNFPGHRSLQTDHDRSKRMRSFFYFGVGGQWAFLNDHVHVQFPEVTVYVGIFWRSFDNMRWRFTEIALQIHDWPFGRLNSKPLSKTRDETIAMQSITPTQPRHTRKIDPSVHACVHAPTTPTSRGTILNTCKYVHSKAFPNYVHLGSFAYLVSKHKIAT